LPISNAQTKLADVRLRASEQSVIRKHLQTLGPEAEAYLFGARTDDSARGGDIDLLVLTPTRLPLSSIRKLRRGILSEIGEQKIDIVNLVQSSRHPFKTVALETAVRL
jgi:predicted nucleotidyltransferase